MQKKDVFNWIIVSSVIALLIIAYLLVAVPKDVQQDIQEEPLTETSNTGDSQITEISKRKSIKQIPSDNNVPATEIDNDQDTAEESDDDQNPDNDEESEQPDDKSEDNDQCPGGEDSDDSSDDMDDEQQDDNCDQDDDSAVDDDQDDGSEDDEQGNGHGKEKPKHREKWGENTPPMKWGLVSDGHDDNANDRANEVRYDSNGKAVGNPLTNPVNGEDGDSLDQDRDNGKQPNNNADKNDHGVKNGKNK
ncbi:MAG TPA: hypothetical protein ENN25_02455 [Euryarchaeota archaeon]|nr:hypothetical protein [Euryarchaeota archaeon]